MDKLMSLKEAAAALDVSYGTILRHVKQKNIEAVKVLGRNYIKSKTLQNLLEGTAQK